MKKSKILVFGLLAALVLVGAGAGKGFSSGGAVGMIKPVTGSCCDDDYWTSRCYATDYQECQECCVRFQNDSSIKCINDRFGCNCCYMPGEPGGPGDCSLEQK